MKMWIAVYETKRGVEALPVFSDMRPDPSMVWEDPSQKERERMSVRGPFEIPAERPQLMAFWHYDQYPFISFSEVEQFLPDGSVKVTGYNRSFRPFLLLPLKQGEEAGKVLQAKREQAEKELIDTLRQSIPIIARHLPPEVGKHEEEW